MNIIYNIISCVLNPNKLSINILIININIIFKLYTHKILLIINILCLQFGIIMFYVTKNILYSEVHFF